MRASATRGIRRSVLPASALGRRPMLPFWAALLAALGAGPLLDLAFPSVGVWPLAPVALAVLFAALRGRSNAAALLLGFVFGEAFYLVHIEWATLFLGVVPWAALSTLQALFVAAGALLVTLAYRWVPRVWPTRWGRLGLLPLVVAGVWTLREGVSSTWPYGGFAWGRIGQSQSESPLRDLYGWIGTAGVTFVVVWFAAFAFELALEARRVRRTRFRGSAARQERPLRPLAVASALAAVVTALVLPTAWHTADAGSLRVAAVQGDTRSGYFQQRAYQGEILDGHISATLPVIDDGADVIVWPEGAADLDPLTARAGAEALDLVAEAAGAPIVTGTITERGDDIFNSSVVWEPGEGATAVYDKHRPVPFGEYVPDRAFWEPFAPDLIGLIGREYTPGTTSPVVQLGDTMVGLNICFDIIDDALLRQTAREGAEIVFAQTNNADFGQTDESAQQLAFARIRAQEIGRAIVNISTVSASEIIAPSGEAIASLPAFEPGAMVNDVPLRTGVTPYVVVGGHLEWLLGLGGLGVLAVAGVLRARRRGRR